MLARPVRSFLVNTSKFFRLCPFGVPPNNHHHLARFWFCRLATRRRDPPPPFREKTLQDGQFGLVAKGSHKEPTICGVHVLRHQVHPLYILSTNPPNSLQLRPQRVNFWSQSIMIQRLVFYLKLLEHQTTKLRFSSWSHHPGREKELERWHNVPVQHATCSVCLVFTGCPLSLFILRVPRFLQAATKKRAALVFVV